MRDRIEKSDYRQSHKDDGYEAWRVSMMGTAKERTERHKLNAFEKTHQTNKHRWGA